MSPISDADAVAMCAEEERERMVDEAAERAEFFPPQDEPPMRSDAHGVLDLSGKSMCPHCGALVALEESGLTQVHDELSPFGAGDVRCPGSEQNPRNPQSDLRSLWNGQRNPHAPAP